MKSSVSKSTFSPKSHRTPKKKRAPRGSLLGSGIGSGKSNLWTLEQRKDLYNRRQNGEDWESICNDYPTRTRHAMQQQYSVEKRKNAGPVQFKLTGKRGGRKPRAAQTRGHNWTSINRIPLTDEEDVYEDYEAVPMDLEVGEDDDTDYEDVSHAAEESSQPPDEEVPAKVVKVVKAPRPPPLPRSATEPSRPGRKGSKKALFPNLPASAGLPPTDFEDSAVNEVEAPNDERPEAPKRKSSAVDLSESESRSSSHQSKRPKYSTDPSEVNAPAPSNSEQTPSIVPKSPYPAIVVPEVVFSIQEVAKAQERARELSALFEAERTSRREASEAAQKRANRRANEAEQKLLEAGQEYAMKLKVEKAVIAKDMATLTEERNAATSKNAEITKELEACKLENKQLKEAPPAPPQTDSSSLTQQLARQESQLRLYDQLRTSLTAEAQNTRQISQRLKLESNEHNIQQFQLTESIRKLNDEYEDLSNKAIAKFIKEIQLRNEELVKQRSVEMMAYENMMKALEAFTEPFAVEAFTNPRAEGNVNVPADGVKSASPPEKVDLR